MNIPVHPPLMLLRLALRRAMGPRLLLLAAGAISLALGGCRGEEKIDTTFGRRSGPRAVASVNGTVVLSEMFEQAGHRVSSWRRLSQRLERCDTIIWAPDNTDPPSDKVCRWLEDWLREDHGRTLVYIGRDYSAEVDYWRAMRSIAPPEQAIEVQARLAKAMSEQDQARSGMPSGESCKWFSIEGNSSQHRLEELEGDWSEGINAAQADLRTASLLNTEEGSHLEDFAWDGELTPTRLLHEGDEVLVTQLTRGHWYGSKLIVIDNGCFLLNLPLVNHEHRKLAARLIEECGPPGRGVVFLESDSSGLPIGSDADARPPTGLEAFLVWPINVLMMHLAILGIVFSFAMFPIFGRPHEPKEPTPSDFGKHIRALGELLQRSGDAYYAKQQLRHYHDNVRRDSGESHRK